MAYQKFSAKPVSQQGFTYPKNIYLPARSYRIEKIILSQIHLPDHQFYLPWVVGKWSMLLQFIILN